MKKLVFIVLSISLLASCATHEPLKAPCTGYGDNCPQENINSWN